MADLRARSIYGALPSRQSLRARRRSVGSNCVKRFTLFLFLVNPGEFSSNPDVPVQVNAKRNLVQAQNGAAASPALAYGAAGTTGSIRV